jgi:hypothetical protein
MKNPDRGGAVERNDILWFSDAEDTEEDVEDEDEDEDDELDEDEDLEDDGGDDDDDEDEDEDDLATSTPTLQHSITPPPRTFPLHSG